MKKIVFLTTAVTLLSACGGGGGGDSSVGAGNQPAIISGTSIALTPTNYESAGKEVISGVSNANTLTSTTGLLTGAEINSSVNLIQFVQMKYPLVLKATKQPAYLSGVAVNETQPCAGGGSIRLAGEIRSEVNPTPGDVITLNAIDCREVGAIINGAMIFRFTSVSGDVDNYPFTFGVEVSTNNFQAVTSAASFDSSGSMTMSFTSTSDNSQDITLTMPNLVSRASANGKTETFQYVNYRMLMSVRGSSTSISLSGGLSVPSLGANLVTIQTDVPFASTTLNPTSGSLTASASTGGKMRISATAGNLALIELDANSDGAYETNKTVPWSTVF